MAKVEIPLDVLRKRSLFIATPMYGGMCGGPFTKACLDLVTICMKYGVQVQFFFLFNESLITRARNYLVDEFLRSPCTHLMFIDSDIDFNPMDVLALLALDKDIVGGPYPKKTIAWEKVYDAAKLGLADDNPNKLELYTGDYVFNVAPGTKEVRMDEPVKVLEIGTGFMMVKKEVFPKFREAYPELSYKPDHNRTVHFDGAREIHCFFQALICPDSKRYLSEDYMFCQWSRKIGYDIYFCPWMKLKHAGMYIFGGALDALAGLSQLQQQAGFSTPVMRSMDEVVTREVRQQEAAGLPAPQTPPTVTEDEVTEAPKE